jgi:hypothetical protein
MSSIELTRLSFLNAARASHATAGLPADANACKKQENKKKRNT